MFLKCCLLNVSNMKWCFHCLLNSVQLTSLSDCRSSLSTCCIVVVPDMWSSCSKTSVSSRSSTFAAIVSHYWVFSTRRCQIYVATWFTFSRSWTRMATACCKVIRQMAAPTWNSCYSCWLATTQNRRLKLWPACWSASVSHTVNSSANSVTACQITERSKKIEIG